MAAFCNCRQPGLGGDCDGSCLCPSPQFEQERCAEINHTQVLNQPAFEAAWAAFQNTPIDLVADSDDEQCRCLWSAIRAYISFTSGLLEK